MADDAVVLVLPGDGIGPEIMAETVRVAEWFNRMTPASFTIEEHEVGGAAYRRSGSPLPAATLERAREADAVLLGCVGDPDLDYLDRPLRPSYVLWFLRRELDLCINLRPIIMRDALVAASSLKPSVVQNTDFVIVRELTEGLYYGEPRGKEDAASDDARACNTMFHTRGKVRRVARAAFELARTRRGKVCSVDKSNVLEAGELWREEVTAVHQQLYRDVSLSHMYVDNAAMQIVRAPSQFDVVVTENLFGDILSDTAAMTTGSIGTLPSAALARYAVNQGRVPGLYEPIHGSAPDIAGLGKANPIGCIMSLAMLMEYSLDMKHEARQLDRAVSLALRNGARTFDIARGAQPAITTRAMGDAVIKALEEVYSDGDS